jgi:hypothetical protein
MTLPFQALLDIASELEVSDLQNFCQVCKRFCEIGQPLFYTDIEITAAPQAANFSEVRQRVRKVLLSMIRHPYFANKVRTLTLGSLTAGVVLTPDVGTIHRSRDETLEVLAGVLTAIEENPTQFEFADPTAKFVCLQFLRTAWAATLDFKDALPGVKKAYRTIDVEQAKSWSEDTDGTTNNAFAKFHYDLATLLYVLPNLEVLNLEFRHQQRRWYDTVDVIDPSEDPKTLLPIFSDAANHLLNISEERLLITPLTKLREVSITQMAAIAQLDFNLLAPIFAIPTVKTVKLCGEFFDDPASYGPGRWPRVSNVESLNLDDCTFVSTNSHFGDSTSISRLVGSCKALKHVKFGNILWRALALSGDENADGQGYTMEWLHKTQHEHLESLEVGGLELTPDHWIYASDSHNIPHADTFDFSEFKALEHIRTPLYHLHSDYWQHDDCSVVDRLPESLKTLVVVVESLAHALEDECFQQGIAELILRRPALVGKLVDSSDGREYSLEEYVRHQTADLML